MTLIQAASPERNKNTHAAADFLKGKYNTLGAAASAENAHHGQVAKLIKKWENNGAYAALHEAPCDPVDLVFPDDKVDCINKTKGNFNNKTLAVELAAALILNKKPRAPPQP